jgi:glycosyltransferase involved in cell wall biosynthesis
MEDKKYDLAIKSFDSYLKHRKDETSERYQVLIHKALCYKDKNKWRDMRDCIQLAKGIDPFRRDGHTLLADMYIHLKQWEKAVYELTSAMRLNPKASRMFQNGASLTWQPHQNLAMCYEKMGEIPKATAHLKQALKYFDNEKWRELLNKWSDKKKNVLILDDIGSFTKEFFDYLKKDFHIVVVPKYENRLVRWADYIWCEWGSENAFMCSKNFPEKTVVRVHGFEAYIKGFEDMIQWDKLKNVVFVANHIKERMKQFTNGTVIQNGVNTDKFYIKKKNRDADNIGIVGYMNSKKNPMLLAEIIKKYPGFKFHLRIDWQDPFLKAGFEHEVRRCKNVVYHGRYKNLNDFWNKMSMVISTSIIESFSFNIAEAMACGCKPLIYNWKGAKDIWNSSWIFNDISDLNMLVDKKITPEQRQEYRDYIMQNYPLNKSLQAMKEVLIARVDKQPEKTP